MILLKFLISVRDGRCDYLPRAHSKPSYATDPYIPLYQPSQTWNGPQVLTHLSSVIETVRTSLYPCYFTEVTVMSQSMDT